MPFAGNKDFADCVQKQIAKGKDKESASKICGSIKSKVEGKEKPEGNPFSKDKEVEKKKLEADILKLEIKRDMFVMDIAKSLIVKVATKLANKPAPSVDDVRTLSDLVWMYRSEKRDQEEPKMM